MEFRAPDTVLIRAASNAAATNPFTPAGSICLIMKA